MKTEEPHTITTSEFGKLFSEYRLKFIKIAYRYVRDHTVAEDLVSDSFVSFWESKDSLPADVNAPAYILTTVKNNSLNYLNAQLRHIKAEQTILTTSQRLLQADILSLSACEPKTLFSDEVNLLFDKAVAAMPEMTRKVFLASRRDGKSYKEMSAEFGIAVTHVNFEMRRALNIMRNELKDYIPIAVVPILILLRF